MRFSAMKNNLALFVLPFICLFSSCNEEIKSFEWKKEDNYTMELTGFDKDVMPIAGYSGPSFSGVGATWDNPTTLKDDDVKKMWVDAKEAGFNTMYTLYWAERIYSESDIRYDEIHNNIIKNLSFADEVGLKYVVMDYVFDEYIEKNDVDGYREYIQKTGYLDHESFLGFVGKDEPTYDDFDILCERERMMEQVLPNYLFSGNLLPEYVDRFILNGHPYENYIDDYIEQVRPRYVSYDFYAPIGRFPQMRDNYFYQLAIIKEKCDKYGLPFWNFVLTSEHYDYRLITDAELYWQINTSLAYGVKGIQYFNFRTPLGDDYMRRGGSIINEYGERTTLFEAAKRINGYISTIDEILMNSSQQLTIGRGNNPCYFYYREEENKEFRELKDVNVTSGGVVVGCFDHQGKTVLFVSSNDVENSSAVSLSFSNKIRANLIGMDETKEAVGKNISLNIKPGEAYLVEIL